MHQSAQLEDEQELGNCDDDDETWEALVQRKSIDLHAAIKDGTSAKVDMVQ